MGRVGPQKLSSEVVIEYLRKWPSLPSMTLAKKIYAENKAVFNSVEHVRTLIRTRRGTIGKWHQKWSKNRMPLVKKPPRSYAEKREPFILPTACNNILLISDLHIPYHDNKAIKAALDYGKEQKINTVIINGDLMDFHQLSRFEHDPRKRRTKEEFEAAGQMLDYLHDCFPRAYFLWHYGNHDIRYEKWLMVKAPEIFDDPYYSLEERLQLIKRKIHIAQDKQIIKAGHLNIMHGHTIFRGSQSPVSPARTIFLKTKESTICGHTHKISEYTATKLNGDIITCWGTGSLCELSPDYAPHGNDYGHGFAHIKIDKDGWFSVNNMRIHNGKIL